MYIAVSCKRYLPTLPHTVFFYQHVVNNGTFQKFADVCGCLFLEPKVFEIAHMLLRLQNAWLP